jgi:hypothetical protein
MKKEYLVRLTYEITVEEDCGTEALHTGVDFISEYAPSEWSVKQIKVSVPESSEVYEFSKKKEREDGAE